jgi:hypothetical protein
MGAKQLEATDERFRWLRYANGPLHGRTALYGWFTDEQVPERLTARCGHYHFERNSNGFQVRVDDGDASQHRYLLTRGELVVGEREVEEERKREVIEEDEDGKEVKRTVVELVTRRVPVVDDGGYLYVGPGAWPEDVSS